MNLWIRSQDRETLMIASHLDIYNLGNFTEYYIEECGVTMGCYKDKERALEVLDEIQNLLKGKVETNHINKFDIYNDDNIKIYEMPKE